MKKERSPAVKKDTGFSTNKQTGIRDTLIVGKMKNGVSKPMISFKTQKITIISQRRKESNN